jgi:hypothetical protein
MPTTAVLKKRSRYLWNFDLDEEEEVRQRICSLLVCAAIHIF